MLVQIIARGDKNNVLLILSHLSPLDFGSILSLLSGDVLGVGTSCYLSHLPSDVMLNLV